MKAPRWLKLIVLVLALAIAGRMALRFLDWQASKADRAEAQTAIR